MTAAAVALGATLRHHDGRTGTFVRREDDGRYCVQSLKGKGFWVFHPDDCERIPSPAISSAAPAAPQAAGDARKLLQRTFWRLSFDAVPALDNPGDCKWRLSSTAARILADAAVAALRTQPQAPDALRVAVSDIAAERQRQIETELWSAERDDEYIDRSLAHAAAAYALGFDLATRRETITEDVSGGRGETPVWKNRQIRLPAAWPISWDAEWWKPSDARRDLVKAGALIVAEIERIDRQALASLQANQKGDA